MAKSVYGVHQGSFEEVSVASRLVGVASILKVAPDLEWENEPVRPLKGAVAPGVERMAAEARPVKAARVVIFMVVVGCMIVCERSFGNCWEKEMECGGRKGP